MDLPQNMLFQVVYIKGILYIHFEMPDILIVSTSIFFIFLKYKCKHPVSKPNFVMYVCRNMDNEIMEKFEKYIFYKKKFLINGPYYFEFDPF